MAIRKTPFIVNEYYHVYNRGVDKRIIFNDEYDYGRFMMLLYLCNGSNPVDMRKYFNKGESFVDVFSVDRGKQLVDIGAYCLMPNHFHILIRERTDGGISMFMKKISTGYSMYFNEKYNRTGILLGRPFRAKHIDNESYFNWVFLYTHVNPVKLINPKWKDSGVPSTNKVREFIENYKYSSYPDYFVGDRTESIILNKNIFPGNFSQFNDFDDMVQEFNTEIKVNTHN